MIAATTELELRVDLEWTLGHLRRGGGKDTSVRIGRGIVDRATRTPQGPASQRITALERRIRVEAWGPGAEWLIAQAPALLGALDHPEEFRPRHPALARLHRELAGLRIGRSGAVFEAAFATVLEQKIPSVQARWAYRTLVDRLGEMAPGPLGLWLPPSPERIAETPYWILHQAGVEQRRAQVIQWLAVRAPRLEQTLTLPLADAYHRLRDFPGIGPWSAAEVARVALGDADAVSVGDFHLPHVVSWTLEGRARGSDARMLELLEPYRSHRGRVLRMLELSGITPPRFGPHLPLRWIARS